MRVAIIDLGTNSVRFDVHQIGQTGGAKNQVRQLHREKLMVRLGQGVFLDGKLDKEAMRRTLQAFMSFDRTAKELHVNKVIAFATSALREASDGDKLLNLIRTRTGIDVRVISGAEEARLIALGVISHEKIPKGRYGLIDIGGGSTEISLCTASKVHHSESFPLGTARLQQVFLKSSPPKDLEQLRRYIKSVLLAKMISEGWPKVDRLMGSSGTIRALAKIVKKTGGGSTVDRGDLKKLVKMMSAMTTTQLLGLPGMEAKRVDMILAGAILLEECMEATGAKKVFTTEYSLRDGILAEQIQLVKFHKTSPIAFHLSDIRVKVESLMDDSAHFDRVILLSDALFVGLAKLHKLKPEWKTYLTAAALLHDVGEIISPANHERHSYYFVKNADFPSMEKWECEFIAQLCLRHRVGKVDPKELPFNGDKKIAFIKLLALLRIADALDRGHKSSVKIKSIQIARSIVTISIESGRNGKTASYLEVLRVEQKRDLFEQVFHRSLVVKKA